VTISVLLVDDHRLVREAVRNTLAREPDIEVVGEAGDASGAFEHTRDLEPDVIVLAIALPDLSGIEVASRLREVTGVDSKIVALSFHTEERFVTAMLRAGASAYVTKSSALAELIRAIRAVADGHSYVCPEVAETLVTTVRDGLGQSEQSHLSQRERDVLELIARGVHSSGIGAQLHISPATVEVHRRNVMRKLGLHTVAELTRYAIREGMVSP
jgi:two-component system NarL family response regulator